MSDEDKEAKEKRDAAKGVVKEAVSEWFADKEKELLAEKAKNTKTSGGFLDSLLGR